MNEDLRKRLTITPDRLEAINRVLLNPDSQVVNNFLEVVSRHGTPDEINRKAEQARQLPRLLDRVRQKKPEYLEQLETMAATRETGEPPDVAAGPTDYETR